MRYLVPSAILRIQYRLARDCEMHMRAVRDLQSVLASLSIAAVQGMDSGEHLDSLLSEIEELREHGELPDWVAEELEPLRAA